MHLDPFTQLGLLVTLAVAAQWLAWRVRIPGILLLLTCGLAAGMGSELLARAGLLPGPLIDPEALFGSALLPMVSLAVGLILFEGGMTLNLAELRAGGGGQPVLRLVTFGAAITGTLAALLARITLGCDWPTAAMLGGILTVTGPTVVGPLLRDVRPLGTVAHVLRWEGIVIDPIGAIAAVVVFEVVSDAGQVAWWQAALNGAGPLVFGSLLGAGGGALLTRALQRRWAPEHLESPFALASVVALYVLSNSLQHESGLAAVTVMGIWLANQRRVAVRHVADFKEALSVLLVGVLFVVLGARLRLEQLQALDWRMALFVAGLIFLVRPAAVVLSTLRAGLARREVAFASFLAPRGIVAASVASVFALRLEEAGRAAPLLVPAIFSVIFGTVTFYALTARPLARRLGLRKPGREGFLIVGASPFARGIARALRAEGCAVLLVDTNAANAAEARLEGLPVLHGSALSNAAYERVQLGDIGRLLALTANDEVNSLAALHYARLFGRDHVFHLAPEAVARGRVPPIAPALRGRHVFRPICSHDDVETLVARGATVRVTRLSHEYPFERLASPAGPDVVIALMAFAPDGAITVFAEGGPDRAGPGWRVLTLSLRRREAAPPAEDATPATSAVPAVPAAPAAAPATPAAR